MRMLQNAGSCRRFRSCAVCEWLLCSAPDWFSKPRTSATSVEPMALRRRDPPDADAPLRSTLHLSRAGRCAVHAGMAFRHRPRRRHAAPSPELAVALAADARPADDEVAGRALDAHRRRSAAVALRCAACAGLA